MRLFIAIALPEPLRRNIGDWAKSLIREIPDPERRLHWVKEDQFHLTLKFLGETREDQLPALREALKIAATHERFSLSLSGIGHFGGRVVWLGVQTGKEEITRLAQSVDERCEAVGFERESKNFHPHLTLARSKTNPGTIRPAHLPPSIVDKTFGPFATHDVCLFRSTITSKGAIYEILGRYPLL